MSLFYFVLKLLFWKGCDKRHSRSVRGGQRGSALCLVLQRWEAVFRRERKPVSFDRTSMEKGKLPFARTYGRALPYSRFPAISKE